MDQNQNQVSVPVVCIDMDGVIWKNGHPIEGSREALLFLTQDLKSVDAKYANTPDDSKMPLIFITNSGACLEEDRSDRVNKLFNLPEEHEIGADNIILNFTPLREEMEKFKDQAVLIAGQEDYEKVAIDCGLNKYITYDEYARLYPQLVPFCQFSQEEREETRRAVKERHQIEDDSVFNAPMQVHAIFFLFEAQNLENIIQITMDVLTTEDGKIAKHIPKRGPKTHIPVYSVVNDHFFPSKFSMNRLGFGSYLEAIKAVYKAALKRELKIHKCGKPTKMTFEYAHARATLMAENIGCVPSQFYMIGDNPQSDIRGANKHGWHSILVRTGIYKDHHDLDIKDDPDVIVDDFKQAIQYICKQEGLTFNY